MASEFTRKVQKIKDILKFNSMLADDGDVLLTKDGEVYTQVNGKVKQLSNPNYGKDNANKILSVSDTGDAVPIPMPTSDDILSKDNTFTGTNKFTKPIDGSLLTSVDTFTKFADVAQNMPKYAGYTSSGTGYITDMPYPGWAVIHVQPRGNDLKTGIINLSYTNIGITINGHVNNGTISWEFVANYASVINKTDSETISGDKTFNGQTTLLNGNFGLRVTNSGIVKTTDAGKTWVAL
jgi:hypothetical protein